MRTVHAVPACYDADTSSKRFCDVFIEPAICCNTGNRDALNNDLHDDVRQCLSGVSSHSQRSRNDRRVLVERVDEDLARDGHCCTGRPAAIHAAVPPGTFTEAIPKDSRASQANALRRPDWQMT